MRKRTWYDLLAVVTLGTAGTAAILAVIGAALQRALSVAAASLCAVVFFIPGVYFLGYARRLQTRDLALAHAAAYAHARGTLEIKDLASELGVPDADAKKILQTAVRDGHIRGRFDDRGRFIAEGATPELGGRPT